MIFAALERPAATEVVVALSITGRPEPAITAKLLDADLAGVASRDIAKDPENPVLEAEKPANYEFDLQPASALDLLFGQSNHVKEGTVDRLLDAPDVVLKCRATDAASPCGAFLDASLDDPCPSRRRYLLLDVVCPISTRRLHHSVKAQARRLSRRELPPRGARDGCRYC